MSSQKTKDQLAEEKQRAAAAALTFVRSGMRLGLGSGSTSHAFIRALGERVRAGALRIEGIATSKDSEELARGFGIPLIQPARGLRLDLAIDGADEIDPELALIKGGGGALLREKAVARASRTFLVIADSSKCVDSLGAFPLPVEVIPFTLPWVLDELEQLGTTPTQRMNAQRPAEPYFTDQGNYIVDCRCSAIGDARALAAKLESVPGIAEHGLFIDYATSAIIADDSEVFVLRPRQEREKFEPPKP